MSDILSEDNRTTKAKTKDSVFTTLFKDVNNVYRLYKELHTEDTTTTVADIQIDTLETILINDIHNDLGFLVNNNGKAEYILLMEAQTKWTENMTLRMLFYLVESYRRYLIKTEQSEHSSSKVHLPKPEMYIVYTGSKEIPDEISFKDKCYDGVAPIDVVVKVLRMPDKDTLYGQYIAFSKVYDGQRKIHKEKIECIRNTLDICIKEGYLREFFEQHRQEVTTMLSSLFDEQVQREQYDIAVKAESKAEGIAEGIAKGITQGKKEGEELGKWRTLAELVKKGLITLAQAAAEVETTPTEFEIKTAGMA